MNQKCQLAAGASITLTFLSNNDAVESESQTNNFDYDKSRLCMQFD